MRFPEKRLHFGPGGSGAGYFFERKTRTSKVSANAPSAKSKTRMGTVEISMATYGNVTISSEVYLVQSGRAILSHILTQDDKNSFEFRQESCNGNGPGVEAPKPRSGYNVYHC